MSALKKLSSSNPKSSMTSFEVKTENSLIKDFCESTSLHGVGFLYNANTLFTKLVWILAIIAMTVVGAVFLMENTVAYNKSKLVTTIESSTANLSVSMKYKYLKYRSIAISNTSHLEAHPDIFRPLIKGIYDAYIRQCN